MSIREHPSFLRVWSGQVVSNLGDGVHRIALLWWTRQSTGSDAAVVIVALATVVPSLLAAPLAGWVVDRMSRRTVMLVSDAVRMATSIALGILLMQDSLGLPLVVMFAALAAVATAAFEPALYASITTLVGPDSRTTANSMLGASSAIAGIVGPALGGMIIAAWDTQAAMWFDAATFAVSFLLVASARIPRPVAVAAEHEDGVWAGWRLLKGNRPIRDLVTVAGGLNLSAAPIPVLVVALAAGPLGLDGTGFGLLAACLPAGMVLGLLLAPRLARARFVGVAGVVVSGAAIAAAGMASWAPWVGLWLAVAGAGVGVVNAVLPTRFQAAVDPTLQGRVFALAGAASQAGRPIGLLVAVPLVTALGAPLGLVTCGAALALVGWGGRRGLVDYPGASETVDRYTCAPTSSGATT